MSTETKTITHTEFADFVRTMVAKYDDAYAANTYRTGADNLDADRARCYDDVKADFDTFLAGARIIARTGADVTEKWLRPGGMVDIRLGAVMDHALMGKA